MLTRTNPCVCGLPDRVTVKCDDCQKEIYGHWHTGLFARRDIVEVGWLAMPEKCPDCQKVTG